MKSSRSLYVYMTLRAELCLSPPTANLYAEVLTPYWDMEYGCISR